MNTNNPLLEEDNVDADKYLSAWKTRILQDSEKLFVRDFLFPLLGDNIKHVIPQYPFIDSSGHSRRIDFAIIQGGQKIALEVNGETYHSEGIIANDVFDDNLYRQNEIIINGWNLARFSYSQLQDSQWRKVVKETLRRIIYNTVPELIGESSIQPHFLQTKAMEALGYYRSMGWKKGVVVLPTGTGKTFLSAFFSKQFSGKTLFIVHRLDILSQARDAFGNVRPTSSFGVLTGEVQENVSTCDVLFASKDTLRNPDILSRFKPNYFDYVIVDEVHHGQAPSYRGILSYFSPKFLLGMTGTPDRTDRKDIFELFDYQKVIEYTVNEAIDDGFLVPYCYYGLKDDIDYSKIRYNGKKYNVQDLDKYLIIEKRNAAVLEEYLEKAKGNKAIGFCCSVKHAERMAEYFNNHGISSVAITSESSNRNDLIKNFRNNQYFVAFTVDLFNEGMDFPNVQVLLFLRPTESKTVFLQQLGRGLRLCTGKDKVTVLDFIGNYKKASMIRAILAKGKEAKRKQGTGAIEKFIYKYNPKCEVHFDAEVEEILDAQDQREREITKEDLLDAYYEVAESLGCKPSQEDVNTKGKYKVSKYLQIFGSWVKFLRQVGEYTEASYHYPQGVHLGHILYALDVFGKGTLKDTHFDNRYVRLRGDLGKGKLGTFQRQTKYKLQGLMELGIIFDDRDVDAKENPKLMLTPDGKKLFGILKPVLSQSNVRFKEKADRQGVPSWEMEKNPFDFNKMILDVISKDSKDYEFTRHFFLNMH
ncbi:MAG: DEAD/DEAH box helicase family protein, partial [Candidatus Aminicenantes bacterium]|nr:DEAD/DEAH box helicase family protein [Candidatus Aminicenantes bacterium]